MFTSNERIHEIVLRQASAGTILHRFEIDPRTRTFKLDLEQHLELENEVLFPRALELEKAKGL
jgi:iron-sulfur cluster repair protein YtfE (RIC family)